MNTVERKKHTKPRIVPGTDNTERISVSYGMWWPQGSSQRPSFSITGKLEEKHHRWHATGFGCLHDRIAKAYPELAELIPFHLWDDTGLPMYYVSSGRYCHETSTTDLAKHLAVDVLGDRSTLNYLIAISCSQEGFEGWLESRIPAMKAAFDTMMQKHDVEMIDTTQYELRKAQ